MTRQSLLPERLWFPQLRRGIVVAACLLQLVGVGSAQMIYVDPQTGQITTPPESAPAPKPNARAAAQAPALVEEPLPAGGFRLNTEGRFDVPVTATVNSDGKLVIDHGEGAAAGHR